MPKIHASDGLTPCHTQSAHTRANVFSDTSLGSYAALSQIDQYGVPTISTGTDDGDWNLQNVGQFGGYDELGNFHPPPHFGGVGVSSSSALPSFEITRSDVGFHPEAAPDHRDLHRVTPSSAEYANVAGPWLPSSSAVPVTGQHHSDLSESISVPRDFHTDAEPFAKRRRPSSTTNALGAETHRYSDVTTGGPMTVASSSPAAGPYPQNQIVGHTAPFATTQAQSGSSQKQRGPSHGGVGRADHYYSPIASVAGGLPGSDHISRLTHQNWSQEGEGPRGSALQAQIPTGDGYAAAAIQQQRLQRSPGYYGHPTPGQPVLGPPYSGGMGYPAHIQGMTMGSHSGGSGSGPAQMGSQQLQGYESDSFSRSKNGRDSASQSSDEDAFDAPPPNPKAVALAAAATKGASGTQQQADMLTALNETLSSSLETDGVARCPFPNCTKTFAKNRSYNLKTHLRSHSQLKPFACASCPRAFSRKHDLERHARVHSGDKPYICEVCGRGFPRSDALRRHWRVEKECGDRASEIEAGQPLPSMAPTMSGFPAMAQVPSQVPMSRFTGPNAYPAGWIREQDPNQQHRQSMAVASAVAGPPPHPGGVPMHIGLKRARNEW